MKKILRYLAIFTLIVFLVPASVQAAEFRATDEGEGNVVVSQDEEVKNLYAGGNLVTVNADVEKSLTAGGNVVTVTGDVETNLVAGGGTVIVRGDVGGTAYVGGGNVIIEGTITDDLFVGGGTVTLAETANIQGDLIAGGGVVNIYGPVDGKVYLGAGQAIIDSTVGGPIKAEVEALSFGANAEILGDVDYRSTQEVAMVEGATVSGKVNFTQASKEGMYSDSYNYSHEEQKDVFLGIISFGLLMKFLVLLTSALVLTYFFKSLAEKTIVTALSDFWSNFGVGFAVLFLTPILAIFLLVSVIGSGLAFVLLVSYVLALLLAHILASISLGSLLMKSFKKATKYTVDWKSTLLGVVVLVLLTIIPPIGWMTSFVFAMIGLGTFAKFLFKKARK